MPIDLYGDITYDSESHSVINKLYTFLKPGFSMADGSKFEDRLAKVINRAAVLGLEAAKSKVPIHSGDLRNSHIRISNYANSNSLVANVEVDDGAHTNPKRKQTFSASFIANILDQGYRTKKHGGLAIFHRSKESDASSEIRYGKYSSISEGAVTKGWIGSAQRAFENSISNQIARL